MQNIFNFYNTASNIIEDAPLDCSAMQAKARFYAIIGVAEAVVGDFATISINCQRFPCFLKTPVFWLCCHALDNFSASVLAPAPWPTTLAMGRLSSFLSAHFPAPSTDASDPSTSWSTPPHCTRACFLALWCASRLTGESPLPDIGAYAPALGGARVGREKRQEDHLLPIVTLHNKWLSLGQWHRVAAGRADDGYKQDNRDYAHHEREQGSDWARKHFSPTNKPRLRLFNVFISLTCTTNCVPAGSIDNTDVAAGGVQVSECGAADGHAIYLELCGQVPRATRHAGRGAESARAK
jgi:hypothetical protein